MTTKLDVECPNGHVDVVVLKEELATLEVSIGVVISDPCPLCGGILTAPAGRYEKHPDGTLVRVE